MRQPAAVIFDLLPLEQVVAGNQKDIGARSVLVDRTWLACRGRHLGRNLSRQRDRVPLLTSEAARRRVSGVIRFSAPRSSSLPQRPQFDSFVIHSSNCAFVTLPALAAVRRAVTTAPPGQRQARCPRARRQWRGLLRRSCRLCRPETEEINSSMASPRESSVDSEDQTFVVATSLPDRAGIYHRLDDGGLSIRDQASPRPDLRGEEIASPTVEPGRVRRWQA